LKPVAEVAVSGLHKTGVFAVKRNNFNEHDFIVGNLKQPELSNSQKSFVLPFDTGPVPTRHIHRNTSEQRGSLSPRQGTVFIAAGSPHKQIIIQGGGSEEAREDRKQ
jgi:hypothetical protein